MTKNRLEAFSDGVLAIIARHGPQSVLAKALGRDWKGKLSLVVYIVAIRLMPESDSRASLQPCLFPLSQRLHSAPRGRVCVTSRRFL